MIKSNNPHLEGGEIAYHIQPNRRSCEIRPLAILSLNETNEI